MQRLIANIKAGMVDHLRPVVEGVVANVLGVIASSLLIVRIVSEQGDSALTHYVYHIAVINVISSVAGSGVSNYLIRKWSEGSGQLVSQSITTTLILVATCSAGYYGFFTCDSLGLPAILGLLIFKRSLTAIFRIRREFSILLKISGIEAVVIVAFLVAVRQGVDVSWAEILLSAYGLSMTYLWFNLLSIKEIDVAPSGVTFLGRPEIYPLFFITLVQSLGLYGERFVLRNQAGDDVMTEIFRETYAFRLGLTLFSVLSGVFLGFLGRMQFHEIKSYNKPFWWLSISAALVGATTLLLCRQIFNQSLLVFKSDLSSRSTILLTIAFALFYFLRLTRPIITKFGRTSELVIVELLFSLCFLGALLTLGHRITVETYALALVGANVLAISFSLHVFRRLQFVHTPTS